MALPKDTVTFWLNNAGRYPLLPQIEALRLGAIIQDENSKKADQDRAVKKLVIHNLRLIPCIVRRVVASKRSIRYGDIFSEDLLQVGVFGLERAARKFDPKLGYSFTTYANLWIYQAITREINNSLLSIRIPEPTLRDYYLEWGNIRSGNSEGIKPHVWQRLLDAHLAMNCISLDARPSSSYDEDTDLLSLIYDDNNDTEIIEDFDHIVSLGHLNETQKKVLHLIFVKKHTRSQVGDVLGIDRDKVTRIYNRTLKQLKLAMCS